MKELLEVEKNENYSIENYISKMLKEKNNHEFISLNFDVDMREAQRRYKEDWRSNLGGIKDSCISFNQWLELKKLESIKFHLRYSDYYF